MSNNLTKLTHRKHHSINVSSVTIMRNFVRIRTRTSPFAHGTIGLAASLCLFIFENKVRGSISFRVYATIAMDVPFRRTDILCRRLFMRPADVFRMERVPELFIYGYHKYRDDVNLSGGPMRLKMTKRGESWPFFRRNTRILKWFTLRSMPNHVVVVAAQRWKGLLKGDKSRFIEISGLRKLTSCHTRYSAISGAIGGNVLGRGNYRKSLSFDLVVARWMKP